MSPVKHYKKAESRFVEIIQRFFCSLEGVISSFLGRIVNCCRQQLTVMFIPHSSRNIFNFRISVFSLVVMIFLIACIMMSFVLFSTRFTGVSDLLADKTEVLEQKEADLEVIRDQISDLKNMSHVFESSLLKTLNTLGLDISDGDVSLAGLNITQDNSGIREVNDLKALTALLKDSMEYFDEISKLLVAQQDLIVELPTLWPLKDARGRVTSYFGPTTHPFTRNWYLHKGIDIAYRQGTPLVSTANGKVIEKGFESNSYGNYIVIKHKYGFYTKYAHMDRVYVKEGQNVLQGSIIGTMGNTGLSTGPHLHYEVRIGSQVVDPQRYLDFKNRSGL